MKQLILLSALLFSTILLSGQGEDLPLSLGRSDSTNYLVFHITGDGGMKAFDVKLADEFKAHGMSYIFLNAFKYFWSSKTPDQLANDLIPVLRDYLGKWDKSELILTGFSFGAEVMPFFYNRLPEDLKQKVKLVVMLTPASTSDFTIHFSDMTGAENTYGYDVVKEVEKITAVKVIAVFGEKEDSTFPADHKQENFQITFMEGSHHFTDADFVMDLVLKELKP